MPPPPEILEELRTSTEPRLLTVDEFHRMIESGIIDEDEHVELLEGVLVALTPQSPSHARILQRLTRLFVTSLPEEYVVRVQLPITLGDLSEPEPDFAVVSREQAEQRDRHPMAAPLLVEVSHSTLKKDRRVKASLYARSAIGEYWIVNDREGVIEVHRDPDPSNQRYLTRLTVHRGEKLKPTTLPGPEVDVAALLD